MMNKYEVLEDISKSFDLDRIRKLPVPEKFKLYEYIKLIHKEAHLATDGNIEDLKKSVNYDIDRTYCLFAMLVCNGIHYDLLKEIVRNYAHNFDRSDIYYGKIVILGVGLLLIEQGFASDAIANYLLQTLGDDFLLNNLHYPGYIEHTEDETYDFSSSVITYLAFDVRFRETKYDLLALMRMAQNEGAEYVGKLINEKYGNSELSFYFNMLNISCKDTMKHLYKTLKEDSKTYRMDHLLISGSYAILTNKKVFNAHYLFNSIIGKYSRYDKESSEIEKEMTVRLERLKAL